MPRINAVVVCSSTSGSDNRDLNRLAAAIETAVTSVIGGQCRVIVDNARHRQVLRSAINESLGAASARGSVHSVTQQRSGGSIENIAVLRSVVR